MPQAIGLATRKAIWQLKAQGQPKTRIARALGISDQTVTRILNRDPDDLTPHYARCGRNGREHPDAVRQAAVALKREHPRWGAVLIQLELKAQVTHMPSARTLQRWFRAARVNVKRERRPGVPRDKGRQVHAVWELDGKEQVALSPTHTGRVSAMMAVDEASGALIQAQTFPPRQSRRRASGGGARDLARLV